MNRVGLVLGGGGITGAAYEIATLMSLRIATGWEPNDAEVVVGTSGGAFVSALVRNEALNLDSLVLQDDERQHVAERIRDHIFVKGGSRSVARWLRHGLLPGVKDPGLTFFLGCPAPYSAEGLADWVVSHVGEEVASSWPDRPTAIVAYDIVERRRVAFGTEGSPETSIAQAVAASSAIPMVFHPHEVDGRLYVDGGVVSGTHADLVLGSDRELDLILVLAPMAAEVSRKRALFHEKMFDRVGNRTLAEELQLVQSAWPSADVVVLSPPPSVQNSMRPNPMDSTRAVPTFMRTLISMKRTLAEPKVWERLSHHLQPTALRTNRP